MAARILVSPLLVGMDGSILPPNELEFAQYMVDPLRFSPEGLKEAARYARPESVGLHLSQLDLTPGTVQSLEKYVFKSLEGNTFLHAAAAADPALIPQMAEQFSSTHIKNILADAGKMFSALEAKRVEAKENDGKLWDSIEAHHSPEQRKATYAQMLDTGYPENDRFADTVRLIKQNIHAGIKKLPDYLRALTEHEDITIAALPNVKINGRESNALSNYASGRIAVDAGIALQEQALLDLLLQEEILHYFDRKMQFSQKPEYIAAAEAVLKDTKRMDAIDALSKAAFPEKALLSQYNKRSSPVPELLPNYFIIRDHLRGLDAKGGCAFGGLIRSKKSKEANVDQDMEKLFGAEFHQQCKEFEKRLKEQAKALPAISPR